MAMARVRASTAPLLATYASRRSTAIKDATDARLMMLPLPRASMPSMAARQQR
jgi:hypothetical protein